jgi:hypothetical protein
MLFLRAKVIPVNLQIHTNVMRPLHVDIRLTTKSDRKVKSGGRYSQVVNRKPNFEEKNCYLYLFLI